MRIVGVDVGGTFTDVVILADGTLTGIKVPTTPDQSDGVKDAIQWREGDLFLHGTTAATNAILEQRGATVALVTDAGFEDLLEIGRQDRPSLYDQAIDRPPTLVPRDRRVSDPADLGDVEVVAIGLLDSYLDPRGEQELARSLSGQVVLSSEVSPEFREYERLATTVLTAYLTPSVARYMSSLDETIPAKRRLVMTSAGGLIPFRQAPTAAGRLVLSGPAGGVVAAAALGRHHGHDSVISFDMGGTSTDVCRITGGGVTVSAGHHIAGRVNRVPSVPVRTIGAGGGSIGWLDAGGALRVGPHSAGAAPGPAAYGRGGEEPTVTDANIVMGHIPADLAMGGELHLDVAAAVSALNGLGGRAGLTVEAVAAGILEIVDSHMEHALRSVTVEEGSDPRGSVLVAFGGAGGLHATRLARRLGMPEVLVPPHSGVFSALGLLLASPRADAVRTVTLGMGDNTLQARAGDVSAEAASSYRAVFDAAPQTTPVISFDCRYVGQSHELEVEASPDWESIRAGFEQAHARRFGFQRPGEPIEVVNIRAVVTGAAPIAWSDLPSPAMEPVAPEEQGVWHRSSLPPGSEVTGPAVVVEDNSATVVGPADVLTVLEDGTLRISLVG